jgi:hypothetical protein
MFTKETLEQFRKDFNDFSELVQMKYNMKISLGAIRYDAESFKSTVSAISVKDEVEKQEPVSQSLFGIDAFIKRSAEKEGFTIDISPKGFVGSIYRWPSKKFPHTITGVKSGSGIKNVVQMTASSGTKYVAPVSFFRSAVLIGHI